jgi:hypothetical protein
MVVVLIALAPLKSDGDDRHRIRRLDKCVNSGKLSMPTERVA